MTDIGSGRMFISYATPYDLYKGTLNWNELTPQQQDQILLNETSDDADGISDFIMETGLKKLQAGGVRSILVAASMTLQRHRMIATDDWSSQQRRMVLKFLEGTLFAKRLGEALTPPATQERTSLDGEMLSSVAQTNNAPSVFDATLDMNFDDAKNFMLDHMEKTREVANVIQHQRKMAEAKKVIDQANKFQTIGDQKRLMDAYYEDVSEPPKLTLAERLHALTRQSKAALIGIVFWTAYVIYRTSGDQIFLGKDLDQWYGDDFLINWLGLPILLTVGYFSWRWVMEENAAPKSPKRQKSSKRLSAETQFANDVAAWPDEQRKLVITLLSLVYQQDHKSIFALLPQVEKKYLDRTIEYVRVMKKPPLKKAG